MADALLVTPVTPTAGGNGLAMRAGVFLEGLARSFRVHCLVAPVFGGPGPSDGLVERLAATFQLLTLEDSSDAVDDLQLRLAHPASRARAAALHPRPRLCRAATVAAAHAVADAAADVDLVHVHRLYLAPFLDALLDAPRRPLLTIDIDDLDATAHHRLGDDAEADAYDRLAATYLPDVDHVITASAADATALATAHHVRRISSVPNAVRLPPRATNGAPLEATPTHDLLFVGTMSYTPNIGAALWLCEEVLPHLPHVSIAVIGSGPSPEVEALARHPGVTVVGAVPNIAPWYHQTRVAVVPVREGGGTRIKLLEALAHARPVVSTTVGAEGLDLVAGRDGLLVADDPQEFAAGCRRLLDRPRLARQLASAGRDVVARTASVDVVAAQIDTLFSNLMDQASSAEIFERVVVLGSQLHRNRVAAEACAAIAAAGVRVVLLKGASFGTWLYDSLLERPSGDVDLLIDPADEPAASVVLARLGFETLHGRSQAMGLGQPAVDWVRGQDYVDLHRGRFWGITIPADQSWVVLADRTETIALGGHRVEVLDVAARTFHVVVHAAASGPTAEKPRHDLERVLERVPLGVWEDAARLATTLGADAAFGTGLGLTDEGAELACRLGTAGPASWDRVAMLDSTLRAAGAPPFATGMARLLALPGLRPKVTTAARIVVPTPSYLATRISWARRSPIHTAMAYAAWLGILARGSIPTLAAIRRAAAAAPNRPPHQERRRST